MSRYLLELNWLSPNNRRNKFLASQQTSYNIAENFVSESVYNFKDLELSGSDESNIFAKLNETLTSFRQPIVNQ